MSNEQIKYISFFEFNGVEKQLIFFFLNIVSIFSLMFLLKGRNTKNNAGLI